MNKPALLPILRILLLVHAPSTVHGQQLFTGDAIRVRPSQSTEPGRQWTEATVVRLTPDTLWYQSNDIVSPISIDNAEIRRPTFGNHRWAGLAIGAVAGGAVGGLAAYASYEPRFAYENIGVALLCPVLRCDPPPQVNSRAGDTTGGAVGGAVIGGALGYLVGKMLGRWETVELDQITARDGASLAELAGASVTPTTGSCE